MTDAAQNTISGTTDASVPTSHSGGEVQTPSAQTTSSPSDTGTASQATPNASTTSSSGGHTQADSNPQFMDASGALYSLSSSYVEGTAKIDPNTGMTISAGTATVYLYDQNGLYIGSQAMSLPVGVSSPGFATFVAPPTNVPKGQVAVFTSTSTTTGVGVWKLEEDHRGQTFYDKTNGTSTVWSAPGPIPSNYTTLAPTSPYDRWDTTQNAWVLDKAAQHAAIVSQATDILRGQIMPNLSLFELMNQQPGPKYKAYIAVIQGVAYGTDTTTTTLPTAPVNPLL